MSKTLIVSNRLPVTIHTDENGISFVPSAGGLATGLGSIYKKGNNLWLGWPGVYIDENSEKEEITISIAKENMRPVFLNEDDIHLYYEGFSNETIWPLFHYHTQYVIYNDNYFERYVEVNQKFCNEILKYAEPNDTIWIHDYQLMLLPEMLRKAIPDAKIGYFHHIPFPSYEIFRSLPWREDLLNGLMGSDLIGFHTYDDMRHFLSATSRLIGHDHEMGHIKYNDRQINVDAIPISIDYQKFEDSAKSEAIEIEMAAFKKSIGNQKLIISIDRLDYSKGINNRLYAFENFLETHPEFITKVSLILLVVPSRDQVETYAKLKEEIELLVGRINGKFGNLEWMPIYYFYRSLPFNQLSALYRMCDVALVTPLRDGMNLVCKEYVASRTNQDGVLILSEMAGAAKELSDAILINPNDQKKIVSAIQQALTMPLEEQKRRISNMQSKLKHYDIHRWVEMFMEQLLKTKSQQSNLVAKIFSKSDEIELVSKFKKSKTRKLLLLDYDGTLVGFDTNPLNAIPTKEVLEQLTRLAADKTNQIVIISGRDRHFLQKHLGHIPNIEFVAEHGVWIKTIEKDWELFNAVTDIWKEEILPILQLYVDRTPGTMIEHKDYSLVWHFRKADPSFGTMRARELVSNLQYLTANMDLSILEGNKVIEVKNAGINKGKAALKWINSGEWDFIFAAGDDWTDEDTFKVVPDFGTSIKIGLGVSEADFNVRMHHQIIEILKKF